MPVNLVPATSGYMGSMMTLPARVTYSDTGIVAGTKQIGTIPKGAFHIATHVQMETVGTAALTLGTTSGTANTLVTAGDINETVAALTRVAGLGVISTSAELPVYIKWAQDTAGVANVVLEFGQIPSIERA